MEDIPAGRCNEFPPLPATNSKRNLKRKAQGDEIPSGSTEKNFRTHSENLGNYSMKNIDDFVQRHGFTINTIESANFLLGVILKRISVLDARHKETIQEFSSRFRALEETSDQSQDFIIKKITSIDELKNFEQNLEEKSFRFSAQTFVRRFAGGIGKETVRQTLRLLFSNNILAQFNRHGTNGKNKFIGVLEDFIKDCALKIDPKLDAKMVEDSIVNVFKVSQKHLRMSLRRQSADEFV